MTEHCIGSSVLYIEPYFGGSHKQLIMLLQEQFGGEIYSLPATKWHWRMRVSALYFAAEIPKQHEFKVLFASSVLNLCELLALRPDLNHTQLEKILYFHENQLIYPVRKQQDRDFQYGYNQILSCLVADKIIFNSYFNMDSFLNNIDPFLKLMPDYRPKGLAEVIRVKCCVLYYPLDFPTKLHIMNEYEPKKTRTLLNKEDEQPISNQQPTMNSPSRDIKYEKQGLQLVSDLSSIECAKNKCQVNISKIELPANNDEITAVCSTTSVNLGEDTTVHDSSDEMLCTASVESHSLHIVWPHRWEHDKNPEMFCSVLHKLMEGELNFKLSILGAHTNDIPACFQEISSLLSVERLVHYGPVERDEYWRILMDADVVVSTAKHEFFGVAMLEATYYGCYPLCPNKLVYPEIYPVECLYNTEQQLFKKLKNFCVRPYLARQLRKTLSIKFEQYMWTYLQESYKDLISPT